MGLAYFFLEHPEDAFFAEALTVKHIIAIKQTRSHKRLCRVRVVNGAQDCVGGEMIPNDNFGAELWR